MFQRIITLLIMIGIAVLGFFTIKGNAAKNKLERASLMSEAEALETKGYYRDAALKYEEIMGEYPSRELEQKIVFLYSEMGDDQTFEQKANAYLKKYSDPAMSAELVRISMEKYDYRKAYRYLQDGLNYNEENAELQALELRLDGTYVQNWLDMDRVLWYSEGFVVGEKAGKTVVHAVNGDDLFQNVDLINIRELLVKDGQNGKEYLWHMITHGEGEGYYDSDGYLRASTEGFVPADAVYSVREKKAEGGYLVPVQEDGCWGYQNASGEMVVPATLDDASAFTEDGYAFIKKDNSWYLIHLNRF